MATEYRDIYRREGTMAQITASHHVRSFMFATDAEDGGTDDGGSAGYYDNSDNRYWLFTLDGSTLNPQTAIGSAGIYFRDSAAPGTADLDLILADNNPGGTKTNWPKLYWDETNDKFVFTEDLKLEYVSTGKFVEFEIDGAGNLDVNADGDINLNPTGGDTKLTGSNLYITSGTIHLSVASAHWYIGMDGSYNYRISSSATFANDEFYLNSTGLGLGATPSTNLYVYEDNADTNPALKLEQDGSGDCAIGFVITGTASWTLGSDNNDNQNFKIAASTALGGSNEYVEIDTTEGHVRLSTSLTVGQIAAISSGTEMWVYENTSDTEPTMTIEQAGTGYASLRFYITGAESWVIGCSGVSDSYTFKISDADELGTNDWVSIDAATGIIFQQPDGSGAVPVVTFDQQDTSAPFFKLTNGNVASGSGKSDADEYAQIETDSGTRYIRLYS